MSTPRRKVLLASTALAASAVLAACGTAATPAGSASPAGQAASSSTVTPPSTSATAAPSDSPEPVAISHIHAIARDPSDRTLLLATHEGLYAKEAGGLTLRGPVMDLMGFTVSPDGTFYASGHPGVAVRDLPQPLGLIRSTDRGRTWQVISRGGQSDFHALTAGPQLVVGFDGALRTTSDATQWADRGIPAPPRSLAASPTTGTLVATTEKGLLRSTDHGATWQTLDTPALSVLAAWADESTLVVATTDGRLATSTDRGATWTLGTRVVGPVEALWAGRTSSGEVEVVIALHDQVLRTTDNGATTSDALA